MTFPEFLAKLTGDVPPANSAPAPIPARNATVPVTAAQAALQTLALFVSQATSASPMEMDKPNYTVTPSQSLTGRVPLPLPRLPKTMPPPPAPYQVQNFQTKAGVYFGWMLNGKMHGTGTMAYLNGRSFQGTWDQGQYVNGKYFDLEGNSYTGSFVNGMRSGNGNMVHANSQESCDGQWKDNEPYGVLKVTNKDGFVQGIWINEEWQDGYIVVGAGDWTYQGDSQKQQKHGYGKLIHKDGYFYDGTFENNKFKEGQVKIKTDDRTFEGKWRDGKPTEGTLTSTNGDFFIGTFLNREIATGKGTLTLASGDVYTGCWKDGFQEGEGTLFVKGGDKMTGTWKKGEFYKGKIEQLNGTTLLVDKSPSSPDVAHHLAKLLPQQTPSSPLSNREAQRKLNAALLASPLQLDVLTQPIVPKFALI